MILSDRDIKKTIKEGKLVFKPKLKASQIGPASIDLKLSSIFKVFNIEKQSLIDPKKGLPKDYMKTYRLKSNEQFILHPNSFILASTVEYIKVPNNISVRVEGKSTLARMGILVHTAGFIDPGFEGTITLEISNQSNLAVVLYPGMYICQVAVEYLTSPAENPYNKRGKSLYMGQKNPTQADTKNLF
jgi:dCTP deaminase